MRNRLIIAVILLGVFVCGCSDKMVLAKTAKDLHFFSKTYNASPNECYYAIRWALKINGYPLAHENLPGGILTTTWQPVTSDSHYLEPFASRDYGVTGAYHQLEVRVVPRDNKTKVDVGSRVKSVATGLKTSGVEEEKVLAQIGNYLRSSEPVLSNDGIAE